jgi:hypothetical protein
VTVCASCNLDFTGVRDFDSNRVGRYEYAWSLDRQDGRRCLSVADLEGAGWTQDRLSRWGHPRRRSKTPSAVRQGSLRKAA